MDGREKLLSMIRNIVSNNLEAGEQDIRDFLIIKSRDVTDMGSNEPRVHDEQELDIDFGAEDRD